jgi:WD40 repeat protein
VTFWNPRTGRKDPPDITGTGWVYPAAYVDAGRTLVVGSNSDQAQLWDVASRRLIAAIPAGPPTDPSADPTPHLPGVAVTPDGGEVVTTSTSGIMTVWPLSTASWIAAACRIAGGPLSRSDWRAYIPGLPYNPACR